MKKQASRFDKRGQAAMEFLMTYGWAILAAVIVVGVLWYLLGNPANLAGDQFQISAPLVAKGVVIDPTGVTVNVLNGASSPVYVMSVNLTKNSGCVNSSVNSTYQSTVAVGSERSVFIPCTQSAGARYNTDVVIKFVEQGSTFEQQKTGSLSGAVPK